jgi:hypothetical protein
MMQQTGEVPYGPLKSFSSNASACPSQLTREVPGSIPGAGEFDAANYSGMEWYWYAVDDGCWMQRM